MGARVIKIEHPSHGDDTRAWGPPFVGGESAYYLSVNRNKESVGLNFKTDEGRALLERLIARADVLVENFRPGTLDAAGFGYAALAARYPRLIYVSISGFGQTGPRRREAGYDAVAQAEGGLMSITGPADGPAVRLGVAIADIAAGMFAFQGLLLALIARATTGAGQLVDVSLLDSTAALLTYQASRYLAAGEVPSRTGNRHMTIAPYDTFDTARGVLVLAVGNDDQWQRLCQALAQPALAADDRFGRNQDRVVHYDELRARLAELFRADPAEAIVRRLRDAGVPCGAIRSIDEALADPQVIARAMVETIAHPSIGTLAMLGLPVKLSATPGGVRSAPPLLGQHTRAVLADDLGVDNATLDALSRAGVVKIFG
jgi:crotonobetainyl-CoA:carnitine CoA-transferase CaiB-like acyl-CoA transferase